MNNSRANQVLKLWMKQNQILSAVDQRRFVNHHLMKEILRFPLVSIERSIQKEGNRYLQDVLADLQKGYIAYRHQAGYRLPDYNPNIDSRLAS